MYFTFIILFYWYSNLLIKLYISTIIQDIWKAPGELMLGFQGRQLVPACLEPLGAMTFVDFPTLTQDRAPVVTIGVQLEMPLGELPVGRTERQTCSSIDSSPDQLVC